MRRRARAMAAGCSIVLACGALVVAVCRHGVVAPTALRESGAARGSAEIRPPIEAVAAPPSQAEAEFVVAPRPPASPAAAPANSSSGTGEEALMRLLRGTRRNDPALAIALAREGNRRFPGSSAAPERASILIHALADQGRSSEARGEAEEMVNRYPDSAWVHEIEQFTGARRHRDVRVGPNGELHYVALAPPT